MKLGRCPVCHSRLHLDALVQDEAGRELLGVLAGLDTETGRALVLYLSLFRPAHQDLRNDRALRLARGALELGAGEPPDVLATALNETVDALRKKGLAEPLSDHQYLKRVLKTVAGRQGGSGQWLVVSDQQENRQGSVSSGQPKTPASATARAIDKLQARKVNSG